DRALANKAMMAAYMHEDFLAYDLFVRGHLNAGATETRASGQWLFEVSPHSPYARALLVEYRWTNDIAAKAAQWEAEGARHARLQFALGWRYGSLNRLDDA